MLLLLNKFKTITLQLSLKDKWMIVHKLEMATNFEHTHTMMSCHIIITSSVTMATTITSTANIIIIFNQEPANINIYNI